MIRIKSISYRNKKKYLKQSKNYNKSNVYKVALQTLIRASFNKYISRKLNTRNYRLKNIKFFNFNLKEGNFTFSFFKNYLNSNNICLNVKSLLILNRLC